MSYWTYYHDLSPFIWQIKGSLGLRWYSFAYIFGAVGGWFFARHYILKGRLSIPLEKLADIVTYGAIGAVAGGRLGYCLFYGTYLFFDFEPVSFSFFKFNISLPFWGVLRIFEGGMSSHGGIAGLFISFLIVAKKQKLSFFSLMDLGILGGSVGIFLGRIANFINGELFGNVIKKQALLGVKFPQELFLWSHYAAKYREQILSLKEVLPSLKKFKGGENLPDVSAWGDWVNLALEDSYYRKKVSFVINRIYEASQSGYEPVMKALEPLLSLRHPSQLYQSFFGGLMTFLIVYLLWLKPRKAGFVSFIWAFSYLSFRLFTENFRMPDAFLGYRTGGLTQGQLLSLFAFIVVGLYGFFVYRKSPKGFGFRQLD